MNKEEKINYIIEISRKNNVTAYEIAQNTALTEAGIQRILNSTVKNPRETSLNEIISYLTKYDTNTVKETETQYKKLPGYQTKIEEYKHLLEEYKKEKEVTLKRVTELNRFINLLNEAIALNKISQKNHLEELNNLDEME